MAFISYKVNKNAKKCFDCVFQKLQDKFQDTMKDFYFDRDGLWYKGTKVSFEAIMQAGCSVCGNMEDFQKMYGVPPHEYFREEFLQRIKKKKNEEW